MPAIAHRQSYTSASQSSYQYFQKPVIEGQCPELHLKKCFEAQSAKAALLCQEESLSLALLDMITTRASSHCQYDTKLTWQFTAYVSAMHPFQVQVSQLRLRCICFMLASFHQGRYVFETTRKEEVCEIQ